MVNMPSFSYLSVKESSSDHRELIASPSCMKRLHFPSYVVMSLNPGPVFLSLALESRLMSML